MHPTSSLSPAEIVDGLTKTIGEFERDIEVVKVTRNEDNVTHRELEIGVLKGPLTLGESWGCGKTSKADAPFHTFCFLAKTRKEEIVRFDKAGSDVEFERMMKARILSPEQTELQTQLRRDLRVS